VTAIFSTFFGWRIREPAETGSTSDVPALDTLQRWIAATSPEIEPVGPPLCRCHEPSQPMRWHKDARRKAGGYYECPQRVSELRGQRTRAQVSESTQR
jgi:hypothetical protein